MSITMYIVAAVIGIPVAIVALALLLDWVISTYWRNPQPRWCSPMITAVRFVGGIALTAILSPVIVPVLLFDVIYRAYWRASYARWKEKIRVDYRALGIDDDTFNEMLNGWEQQALAEYDATGRLPQ
jgi:hypothetical protein